MRIRTANKTPGRKKALFDCLETMQLERAVAMMRKTPIHFKWIEFEAILKPMFSRLDQARQAGLTGDVQRWERRIHAISGLREHGPDPLKMILVSDLPEGYNGKILLVHLAGGVVEVSRLPLAERILRFGGQDGIRVTRPLELQGTTGGN